MAFTGVLPRAKRALGDQRLRSRERFTLDVASIYGLEEFKEAQHNLTERQYHALTTAVEQGYYDVPREINAKELADELDISHQALSERFRQGTKNLIKSALLVDEDEEN